MNTNKIKNVADNALTIATNALYEEMQNREADIRLDASDSAMQMQKRRDVTAAVRAFLDLHVPDIKIMDMLSEYFGIDSLSEIKEIIMLAKKSRQIIELRKYCVEKERIMNLIEFRKYAEEKDLEGQLMDNPQLLTISPQKLKEILDGK